MSKTPYTPHEVLLEPIDFDGLFSSEKSWAGAEVCREKVAGAIVSSSGVLYVDKPVTPGVLEEKVTSALGDFQSVVSLEGAISGSFGGISKPGAYFIPTAPASSSADVDAALLNALASFDIPDENVGGHVGNTKSPQVVATPQKSARTWELTWEFNIGLPGDDNDIIADPSPINTQGFAKKIVETPKIPEAKKESLELHLERNLPSDIWEILGPAIHSKEERWRTYLFSVISFFFWPSAPNIYSQEFLNYSAITDNNSALNDDKEESKESFERFIRFCHILLYYAYDLKLTDQKETTLDVKKREDSLRDMISFIMRYSLQDSIKKDFSHINPKDKRKTVHSLKIYYNFNETPVIKEALIKLLEFIKEEIWKSKRDFLYYQSRILNEKIREAELAVWLQNRHGVQIK